jgi:hypothetical protein
LKTQQSNLIRIFQLRESRQAGAKARKALKGVAVAVAVAIAIVA